LGWVTHRGPCQLPPFCDSVKRGELARNVTGASRGRPFATPRVSGARSSRHHALKSGFTSSSPCSEVEKFNLGLHNALPTAALGPARTEEGELNAGPGSGPTAVTAEISLFFFMLDLRVSRTQVLISLLLLFRFVLLFHFLWLLGLIARP